MEAQTQNQTVTGDLHSFLYEIARFSKTMGPHYHFKYHRARYCCIVEHHNGRWTAYVESIVSKITIKTSDGNTLVIDEDNKMYLNGVLVKELCAPGYQCFTAEEIRRRIAVAGLLYEFWKLGINSNEELAKFGETILGEPP
jgi:hypothetical protein